MLWRGDLEAARKILESIPKPLDNASLLAFWRQAMMERRFNVAIGHLEEAKLDVFSADEGAYRKEFLLGWSLLLFGRVEEAQALLAEAENDLKNDLGDPPDPRVLAVLAMTQALRGQTEAALQSDARLQDLLAVEGDAVTGTAFKANRAAMLSWLGRKAAAVALLREVLASPAEVSAASLSHDPRFFDLHEDPEFQNLLDGPAKP